MSNGSEECCALAICCPALSVKQIDILARVMCEDTGLDAAHCRQTADWLLRKYDLAPQGTLQAFKNAISGHAQAHHKRGTP